MIVRPLADRPTAVRDALLSHGWEGDLASLTDGGLRIASFHITSISIDAIETMLVLAPRLGLEMVTGEDWIILSGGRSRLGAFARPWVQPEAVRELAHAIGVALPAEPVRAWCLARGVIDVRTPLVVGILNVTPDSFSDGGTLDGVDGALARAHALVAGGAEIIDVGGESTRPGASAVDPAVEQTRVLPVIARLVRDLPAVPISIDTVHASTAAAALDAGAAIINDVTAGRHDPAIFTVAATTRCGIVLSHSRGALGRIASFDDADYRGDIVGGVVGELQLAVDAATAAGVSADAIVVDPGFGFSKTATQSLALLNQLDAVVALNRAVMVGPSRKRFLGEATGQALADRDRATAAACVIACDRGARLFRVHDPAAVRDAIAVAAALAEPPTDE